MHPKVIAGQNAPNFKAIDVFGSPVNLAEYDSGYTLLVFLRYSGCPWCNLAIHRLTLEYKRLTDKKCDVIVIVQSNRQNIVNNIYDRHTPKPPFPIIPDHEMKLYKRYGVEISKRAVFGFIYHLPEWLESVRKLGYSQKKLDGNFFLVPAWFLINNRTRKIVRSEAGVSFYEHETFISIYDSLTFKD
jgi:peroxiredoxin Q/BCP